MKGPSCGNGNGNGVLCDTTASLALRWPGRQPQCRMRLSRSPRQTVVAVTAILRIYNMFRLLWDWRAKRFAKPLLYCRYPTVS